MLKLTQERGQKTGLPPVGQRVTGSRGQSGHVVVRQKAAALGAANAPTAKTQHARALRSATKRSSYTTFQNVA
jgi:hypothetical protein